MNLSRAIAILATSASFSHALGPNTKLLKKHRRTQATTGTCGDANTIEVGDVVQGTTEGGPSEPVGGVCGATITAPSVAWYKVVGTGNTMTASTCNDGDSETGSAQYDTKISIFCSCDPRICVTGQDDNGAAGCTDFSTKLSWPTIAGQDYYIMVHGFGDEVGEFELAILDDGVPSSLPDDACDKDGDGVNSKDVCLGTVIPEAVPEEELKPNHFALTNDGPDFVKGNGGYLESYNIQDTRGCSCDQIIDQLELGKGLRKFGCSPGVMECWVNKGGAGCDVDCSDEGEDCATDSNLNQSALDPINGGCNSDPPVFGSITYGQSICGTASTFTRQGFASRRDLDWFKFTHTGGSISATLYASFPSIFAFVNTDDCENIIIISSGSGSVNGDTVTTGNLDPGEYSVAVTFDGFSGLPCGSGPNVYTVTLNYPGAETADFGIESATTVVIGQDAKTLLSNVRPSE